MCLCSPFKQKKRAEKGQTNRYIRHILCSAFDVNHLQHGVNLNKMREEPTVDWEKETANGKATHFSITSHQLFTHYEFCMHIADLVRPNWRVCSSGETIWYTTNKNRKSVQTKMEHQPRSSTGVCKLNLGVRCMRVVSFSLFNLRTAYRCSSTTSTSKPFYFCFHVRSKHHIE